jgi:hypothetical protein
MLYVHHHQSINEYLVMKLTRIKISGCVERTEYSQHQLHYQFLVIC